MHFFYIYFTTHGLRALWGSRALLTLPGCLEEGLMGSRCIIFSIYLLNTLQILSLCLNQSLTHNAKSMWRISHCWFHMLTPKYSFMHCYLRFALKHTYRRKLIPQLFRWGNLIQSSASTEPEFEHQSASSQSSGKPHKFCILNNATLMSTAVSFYELNFS